MNNLMNEKLKNQLPALYSQDGKGKDAIVYAHYFCPINGWHWYATEFDGNDLFYGWVKGFENEWGYFSLTEFKDVGEIVRDEFFKPTPLKKVM